MIVVIYVTIRRHVKIVILFQGTPCIYIYFACLSVCMLVCLFVSNKRQNSWTDRAQILCGTLHDPREDLWMVKILKIKLASNKVRFALDFENPRNIFHKIREFLGFLCFTMYIKRNEIEDGRKAPYQPNQPSENIIGKEPYQPNQPSENIIGKAT